MNIVSQIECVYIYVSMSELKRDNRLVPTNMGMCVYISVS